MGERTVRISPAELAEKGAGAVQDAVDALSAAGGGTVELPEASIVLRGPLRLRSGVALRGSGRGTVLRKAPSVSSPVADWLGYGHFEVTVADPSLFEPGMGVAVRDEKSFGFYETVGTVTARDGSALFIDTMLNHDYVPAQGGRVVSVFPLVCADGACDVALGNLTIDGGSDPEHLGGCRGGGVYLLRTHRALVDNVEVRDFNGDAVSFQQCTDIAVRGCELRHNAGGGIHPGSGSVRYRLSGNHLHHNGRDGIFYCLRTTHSDCELNTIHHNGGAGISVGERDTDHAITGNRVHENGGPGLLFRPVQYHGGDRVAISGNAFTANGGPAEVVIAPGIRDVTVCDNLFEREGAPALAVGEGSERIHLSGNSLNGQQLARDDVSDPAGCAAWSARSDPLPVGLRSAAAADTRHLAYRLPPDLPPFLAP
jgi:hypothetical protein